MKAVVPQQVLEVLAGGVLQWRVPEGALEAAQEGLQEVEPGAVSRVFERINFLFYMRKAFVDTNTAGV